MPAYLLTLNRAKGGKTLVKGADVMAVFAENADNAKDIATAKFDGDGEIWQEATATEIAAGANWSGWTFKVTVCSGFGTASNEPRTATVVGSSTVETIDKIGAALVTALNAVSGIANAAYNASTNILTIAGSADDLVEQFVVVEAIDPQGGKSSIDSLFDNLVHNGEGKTAASGTLTLTTAVNDNEVEINGVTYTIKTALTDPAEANEILLGDGGAETRANLRAAMMGLAGEGTLYSTGTDSVAEVVTVTAGAGTLVATANTKGAAGNDITTTSTLDAGEWGAVELEGGDDDGDLSVELPADATAVPKVTAVGKQV